MNVANGLLPGHPNTHMDSVIINGTSSTGINNAKDSRFLLLRQPFCCRLMLLHLWNPNDC